MKAYEDFQLAVQAFIDSPIEKGITISVQWLKPQHMRGADDFDGMAMAMCKACSKITPTKDCVRVTYYFNQFETHVVDYEHLKKSDLEMFAELPDALKHDGVMMRNIFDLAAQSIHKAVKKTNEVWEQFQADFNSVVRLK